MTTQTEALTLALEALEKLVRFESDSWELGSCRVAGRAIATIKEALAQPEQEPVAHCTVRPLRGDEAYPKTEIIWVKGRPVAGPLYTTPPQRKEPEQEPDDLTIAYMAGLHKSKELNSPKEPSAAGILIAVEEAIKNGDCPWQIEQAFDEYESERKAAHGIKE